MIRRLLPLALVLFVAALVAAPPAPPPPATYNVRIRYSIQALRNEHIRMYRDMLADFKAAGFVRDPAEKVPDDEATEYTYTRMSGTVPAKGVEKLLRQKYVKALLIYPSTSKLPAKGKTVRVDLRLSSGYIDETQRGVHRQTAALLTKELKFDQAVGYDHDNYTRLVGAIPVENIDKLVEDVGNLKNARTGYLRRISPVRQVLVSPEVTAPSGLPKFAEVPEAEIKFSPELRFLLKGAAANTPTRLQVIMGYTPKDSDREWIKTLEVPGVVLEGRMGPIVTVYGVPKTIAPALAKLDEVAVVRVPPVAREAPPGPRDAPAKWEPIRASGLNKLHAIGLKGKGTRIAVISDDFKGWQELKNRKEGKLTYPDPVLFDLTAERNGELIPDPYPSAKLDTPQGPGTRAAAAILRAAPQAELTLIRVDAAAPYMVLTAARAINGEQILTVTLLNRLRELIYRKEQLSRENEDLLKERRKVLDDPSAEAPALKAREAYQAKQKAWDKKDDDFRKALNRYIAYRKTLKELKGIRIVASALVWPDGYPVDGNSALSRYFDHKPFKAALWFQAAGDTSGQAWTGLFKDTDGNGIMEFADPKSKLRKDAWTRELNFLGWQSAGKTVADLPAGTVIRLSLQWREAHDPTPLRAGEDPYRDPLAKMRLVVLYQPEAQGKNRPADDLQVIGYTTGRPQRLDQTLHAATYEHTLELRLPGPGRYAVMIRGKMPDSIHPKGENVLPVMKKASEIHPRLFVQTLTGKGRAVWQSYFTEHGSVGMPGDARKVITVGAAAPDGKKRPASASGSPMNMSLLKKPEVLAYDEGQGTGHAASFAAGLAGCAWSSKGALTAMLEAMRSKPGQVLRVSK